MRRGVNEACEGIRIEDWENNNNNNNYDINLNATIQHHNMWQFNLILKVRAKTKVP